MRYLLGVIVLMALVSCTCEKPEEPKNASSAALSSEQQAIEKQEPVTPEPEPVSVDSGMGQIKAKANKETPEVEFDVKTAVLAHFYDKFVICLSDVSDDHVRTSGQFPPAPDNSPPYHKMVLGLETAPSSPGEYVLGNLSYSVKDPEMHFNFGWSGESITGTVTIESLDGELPEEPGGIKARPATITGSFTATNKYGGIFSGHFKASGMSSGQ